MSHCHSSIKALLDGFQTFFPCRSHNSVGIVVQTRARPNLGERWHRDRLSSYAFLIGHAVYQSHNHTEAWRERRRDTISNKFVVKFSSTSDSAAGAHPESRLHQLYSSARSAYH